MIAAGAAARTRREVRVVVDKRCELWKGGRGNSMSTMRWSPDDKIVITVTAPRLPRPDPVPGWLRLARHLGRRHLLVGGVVWTVERVQRSAA
jgi:hypothetical protein